MKFAVRRFRYKLKNAFHEDVTRNIMFNMRSAKDKRLISTIKKFFCSQRKNDYEKSFMVPESIFDKHQVYFCELILKFKDENRFQDYDLKVNEQQSQELKVLKEVMTSMPNVKNLQSFFNHEAIQCLWMGIWNNPVDEKTKKQLKQKRQPPFKFCDDLRNHLK